jgi:peptidyl-prolyl cis-trans isomerase C
VDNATASAPKKARVREWIEFVTREPFFHFIVLGLLIWVSGEYWNAHTDRYTIRIGPAERQRIAMTYRQQFGQLPTPEHFEGLIKRYIREEIFVREGLALNLEKDDEIVRRRITQKYEFLQTDLVVPNSPDPGVLERWFEQNKVSYLTPERVAFSQIYFSPDKEGEEVAKARAVKILRELPGMHASRAPDLGDSFPGPSDVGALAPDEAARLFGQSVLSDELFKAPVARWSGPFRSGYGWHLIYVTDHLPSALPALQDIRERVLADYLEEQRRILNARSFEKLSAQYTIRYDGDGR